MPSVDGCYYAVWNGGAQPNSIPIVLLHGAGGDHQSWPAEIRRLNGQTVLALDLPGHGRSQAVGLQSIAAHAERVAEVLSALNIYQAVLVGHSMGGAIALEVALRWPAYVAGLGLIATGAALTPEKEMLEAFTNPYTLDAALRLFQQRAFTALTPPTLMQTCLNTFRATRQSVLAADWQACAAFDRRAMVNQINAPTWVIVGSDDHLTPVAFAHFLAGSLPAARLQIIPQAGHLVMLEQPAKVAQGLQQFLVALSAVRKAAANDLSLPTSMPTPIPQQQEWAKLRRKD